MKIQILIPNSYMLLAFQLEKYSELLIDARKAGDEKRIRFCRTQLHNLQNQCTALLN